MRRRTSGAPMHRLLRLGTSCVGKATAAPPESFRVFSSFVDRVESPWPIGLKERAVASCARPFAAAAAGFLDANSVADRVVEVVKNFSKVDPSKVTREAKFDKDLGLDSLDAVEVVMAIEEEFAVEIPDAEADKILSVKEAVEYIAANPDAK